VKETVSDEAREVQWGVLTTDKVQRSKKERLVIFKECRVDGRARVTIDGERVL